MQARKGGGVTAATAPEVRYGMETEAYPEESYYLVCEYQRDPSEAGGRLVRTAILSKHASYGQAGREIDRLRASERARAA